VTSASPAGGLVSHYFRRIELEQNKTYQSGLLEAPDLWLWQALLSPVTKTYPFKVEQLASASEPAHLTVWLQGASDYDVSPDHHIRVSLNGAPLGETTWDGKRPQTIEAEVTPGLLLEGQNELAIENVGDTPAAYSMVLLDRFALSYPRLPSAVNGVLEGSVSESGTVEVSGLDPSGVVLDVTEAVPRWLTGPTPGEGGLRFRTEAAHRYIAVSSSAFLRPEVRRPVPSELRDVRNRADYVLVGPRDFLATAQPLLDLRQSQGLRTRAVAIEDLYDQFGFGEARPEALKAFLAYAYHYWQRPSPRYVLLLGDATYDPKDYLHTGVVNGVPPLMVKPSYLWTASDPAYAAVNGDDSLPDLAVGRLPAETRDEARAMIDKIVAFESSGQDLSGPAVLVADNADLAGDFEQDADDLASTALAGRTVEKVYLRDLGGATRATIQGAFDSGPAIVNYIGHGGIAVWASENVWNNLDVDTLAPQGRQPLLFTMNCLNGYFHFPSLNSLAEQFLKAEGKGALAAFAPTGLSVDAPAHAYHKLVLREILSGTHGRLGDAVLAAQNTYAANGDFPELLSIYQLLGDPGLKIR
jgi:Peptidase family C25